MATSSKVKVKTEALLAAVEARRARMVADHEREVAKAQANQEKYAERVVEALRKALADTEKGKLPEHENRYGGKRLCIPVRFEEPVTPDSQSQTSKLRSIDRLIATLKMAAEPTITVSAEDAARYLG